MAMTPLLTYIQSFLLLNREYKGKQKTVVMLLYKKIVTFMTILANGVTVSVESNKMLSIRYSNMIYYNKHARPHLP